MNDSEKDNKSSIIENPLYSEGLNGEAERDLDPETRLLMESLRKRHVERRQTLVGIHMSYDRLDAVDAFENDSISSMDEKYDSDEKVVRGSKPQILNKAVLSGDHVTVTKFLDRKVDANLPGQFGRTPLHNAVLKGDMRMVKLLLSHGRADVGCRDDRNDTPLHFAVRAGNEEIVQVLLKVSDCDVNAKSASARTPLHLAASLDKPEICTTLLESNASFDTRDDQGKIPLGVAMECGAANSARVLLKYIGQMQLDVEKFLYDADLDGSTLLHLAVDSGFTSVVSLCLEYGSRIREPKRVDRLTAFHLACEQGAANIVKLLLKEDPGVAKILLVDKDGSTPLHNAAKSNNRAIVELLIEQGANVNARNGLNVTPLMLAASTGSADSVHLLMEKGADTTVKDIDGRTAVFNAVGHGATMEVLLQDKSLVPLLTEKDALGFAPPHYAAKCGDITSIRLFLEHNKMAGSVLSDSQATPLHVAARHSWHDIIHALVDKQGGKIVNLQDNRGRTPLHYAAAVSANRSAAILLRHGASILRDQNFRTPLHEAAIKGSKKIVEAIIEKHIYCLNYVDEDKNTALHLAAIHGHARLVSVLLSLPEQEVLLNSSNQNILDASLEMDIKPVVLAIIEHDRWREVMTSCNAGTTATLIRLVEKMPDVMERFLNQCIQTEGDSHSSDYKIKYDLSLILSKPTKKNKGTLEVLKAMADNRQDKCLTHPLCFVLLSKKWRMYGSVVFVLNLLMYLAFLIPLTFLHIELEEGDAIFCPERVNNTATGLIYLKNYKAICHRRFPRLQYMQYWLILFTCLHILKEALAFYIQGMRYVSSPSNILDLSAYCAAIFSIVPTCECKWGRQKEAAAIAMFFGWLVLILHLRRLSFYGKYVIMLYRMFVTLLKVLVLFAFFAMAFGTTFFLLIDQEPMFTTLPTVLMSMFIMTLGELNYADNFLPFGKQYYKELANIFMILFCLAMPIIMMNMLVGLAVGDIDKIEKNALIDRYVMQVDMLRDIEGAFPYRLLRRIHMKQYTEYPNGTPPLFSRIFESLLGFGGAEDEEDLGTRDEFVKDFEEIKVKMDEHSNELEEINDTLKTVLHMLQNNNQEEVRSVSSVTADDLRQTMSSILSIPRQSIMGLSGLSFGGRPPPRA
ncbi:transient receptor potential cation channel subfamily A member 1 [Nematostella vectensis]|uniref:transient receptor potential cation channel subfamily A member 1 n=1 Tax=Nematostella vectensis TaxID=45351 RepID=UPI002076E60A|nr:transient receptor potential cation channel subfamily A member 1 [Nematostella vectensis]XP_032219762.2 transient receptor potential cation channel subfamily A member 1 [Nematostella vectensis]XP_048586376.1 transient receptor potential cation channel subfamily A member 1 [Nematostella vectensis]